MEKLNFQSGLIEVSLNKYDDVLVLNSADLKIFERFTAFYDRIQMIADESNKEIRALGKNLPDDVSLETGSNIISGILNANITFSKKALAELDIVFGEGFTGKVFRENYEADPDFVPDELAITELVEAMIPIMEKAYGERIKRHKSKYNAGKRGKHSKTKDDLIAEYKEKKDFNG